jgi:hypothetical protein
MPSLLLELRDRVGPALRVGNDTEAQGDAASLSAPRASGTRFRLRRAALRADGPEAQQQLLERLAAAEGGGLEQALGAQQLAEGGVGREEEPIGSSSV